MIDIRYKVYLAGSKGSENDLKQQDGPSGLESPVSTAGMGHAGKRQKPFLPKGLICELTASARLRWREKTTQTSIEFPIKTEEGKREIESSNIFSNDKRKRKVGRAEI